MAFRKYDYDEVNKFISDFFRDNCRPASIGDVSKAMDIPFGEAVAYILRTLVKEGKLKKINGRYIPLWAVLLIQGANYE